MNACIHCLADGLNTKNPLLCIDVPVLAPTVLHKMYHHIQRPFLNNMVHVCGRPEATASRILLDNQYMLHACPSRAGPISYRRARVRCCLKHPTRMRRCGLRFVDVIHQVYRHEAAVSPVFVISANQTFALFSGIQHAQGLS